MTRRTPGASRNRGTLQVAIRPLRSVFWSVALVSCALNLLMLTGPVFMLQVYDRVLASRSVPTLVALSALAAALYAFWGIFEFLRSRTLSRASFWLDQRLGPPTLTAWLGRAVEDRPAVARPLADLSIVRQFLSSPALSGLFDMPWIPLYLGFVFIIHPWLGWLTLSGAGLVTVLALVNERVTRSSLDDAAALEQIETRFLDQVHRSADAILPMGMLSALGDHWQRMHGEGAALTQQAGERGEIISALSKAIRMILQSAVLGLGAFLAISGEISAGMIVAVSIISGRALAPVDQVIGNWRSVVRARQAFQRLASILPAEAASEPPLRLPAPNGKMSVRNLTKFAPDPAGVASDTRRLILKDVSFDFSAGDAVGVIGPSASGKSSLARILVGAWRADGGEVRLDGALLEQWDRALLGRHIGYLPQNVELLAGTVQQNIARFDPDSLDEDIVAAAQLAGVHEMILRLPDGYATSAGHGATPLSGGQMQRIALARAVFRAPRLVVLDEPNSNLDADGDAALAVAIDRLRQSGSAVVVMAHRPSAIAAVNKLLMLMNGSVVEFGNKDDVLRKVTRPLAAGARA
jgi:ATP-binding cassette subfamily C exporter for protease/lipase